MDKPEGLKFLEEFPYLNGWLVLNGFSCSYSIHHPEMGVTLSGWSDRSKAAAGAALPAEEERHDGAHDDLMLIYCNPDKTVEVFAYGFDGFKGRDEELTAILDKQVKSAGTELVAYVVE